MPSPNEAENWLAQAVANNLQVRIAQANFDIATLEVDRQRAANFPTLDLVASFNQAYAGARVDGHSVLRILQRFAAGDSRGADELVDLSRRSFRLPRAASGRQSDAARLNLDSARRSAQLAAQVAFTGVSGGAAQVKAFEQALKSAQVSYDSTKLGLEVGVRTNLDVLNQQQQVFQTRFNLAQAYYNFVISGLRLKAAVARSPRRTWRRSIASSVRDSSFGPRRFADFELTG
jgi:outer membrane protein